jgi:hypothetical protein
MSDLWAGALLGFFLGVLGNLLVNHYGELRARCRFHAIAKKLAGKWAYNMENRVVDSTPMRGAGLTEVSAKPHWWSADNNILDVESTDTSDGRHHSGPLVIDPACPRLATRILIYDPGNEVVEQRIVISHDFNALYVFTVLATLGLRSYRPAHVLRKVEAIHAK